MLSVGECIIATVSAFYQFGNSRVRVNRKYSEVKCFNRKYSEMKCFNRKYSEVKCLVSKIEFIKDRCCVHYCLS